jgi:FAD/FMN-containing dehydrogenase
VLASEARTAQLIEPAIVAEPASAELVHGPYRQVKRRLAEHGPAEEHPGYAFSKSEFFRQALPDETIAALVDHLASARNPGEARELDFSPWAGAYNRVPTGATAFAHRQERFLLKHGVVADPGGAAAATGWLERSWAIVHPWGSGGVYANFPDPGLADPRAYHGSNYERLVRVKAEYDPDDVFRFPQSLPVS